MSGCVLSGRWSTREEGGKAIDPGLLVEVSFSSCWFGQATSRQYGAFKFFVIIVGSTVDTVWLAK